MKQKFEHKHVFVKDGDVDIWLRICESDGYELVGVTQAPGYYFNLFFKRQFLDEAVVDLGKEANYQLRAKRNVPDEKPTG
jgi:hypothetical protein